MTVSVPNAGSVFARKLRADWHSADLPIHLHQFSAKSLAKAAELAGLSARSISTDSTGKGVAQSLQVHLRKKYLVPQRLSSRLPGMVAIGNYLAKKHDREARGEALVIRLAA